MLPGSCCWFGHVQWKKPHHTHSPRSYLQSKPCSPLPLRSLCLSVWRASDNAGTCSGRCSERWVFTSETRSLLSNNIFLLEEAQGTGTPCLLPTVRVSLCQQAGSVYVHGESIYIYTHIIYFVFILYILFFTYLSLSSICISSFKTDLWTPNNIPGGSRYMWMKPLL